MRERHRVRTLLLLAALAPLACGRREPAPLGPWRSVLLITVDTLRADHLGCYGYGLATSKNLDALAARSTRFERALVPVARTTQSLASLLTGQTPARHGVRHLQAELPDSATTLAERFAAAGFATGAVASLPFTPRNLGLDQGVARFERLGEARASDVTDRALKWLDQQGAEPFFLWLHYRDPHAPLWPPEPWRDRFDPDYDGPFREAYHYWPIDASGQPLPDLSQEQRTALKGQYKFGERRHSERDQQRIRALYDGEIGFTDEHVGRLLTALAERGLADQVVIAFTADHGESLGEHSFFVDHGEFVYDTCVHVPLIVHVPGRPAAVVPEQVGSVDLAPTLLELFGLAPLRDCDGASFASVLLGGAIEPRAVDLESGEPLMWPKNPRFAGFAEPPKDLPGRLRARALPSGEKWIYDPYASEGGDLQLFLPREDPGETRNRAGDPEYAAAAREARRGLMLRSAAEPTTSGGAPIDAAVLNQAGYVGGADPTAPGQPLPKKSIPSPPNGR